MLNLLANQLNLYLVERTDKGAYDEYTAFVVKCNSEDEARKTHPADNYAYDDILQCWCDDNRRLVSDLTVDRFDDTKTEIIGTTRYNRRGWIFGPQITTLRVKHIGISNGGVKGVILSNFING